MDVKLRFSVFPAYRFSSAGIIRLYPMQIKIINPLHYAGWDELLSANENSSFFHSSSWARVLHDCYGYKPLYFTVIDNGNLMLSIPVMDITSILTGKKGVSLPFSDFCEPIIEEGVNSKQVWKYLIDYGSNAGWKYLEIRGGSGFVDSLQPASCYYEHILDLSQNHEKIYSRLRNSHKRNINKAQRLEVKVEICDSIESVRDFYSLQCLTRKRHGLPPQSFSFFEKIHEYIIAKNQGILALARYKDQPVAAALCFHFGKKAIFKYGASDIKYQHLRPNNVVLWDVIKFYCRNDYRFLSLGKTDPKHIGLAHFKTGWEKEVKMVNYYRYDFVEKDFVRVPSNLEGWYTPILKITPIFLLKKLGSILYKHLN